MPGPRSDANGRAGSPSAGRQQTGSHMAGHQQTGSHMAGHQRTGSHMAGHQRTGSPMAGRSGSGSQVAAADRVAHGRPPKDRVTHGHLGQGHRRPASARSANHTGGQCQGPPLQAHLDHHPPVPPTTPWLYRPPPGTHGTSPSKFQRPSPGGALGGGSAMTGAEGNSESHTKSVA